MAPTRIGAGVGVDVRGLKSFIRATRRASPMAAKGVRETLRAGGELVAPRRLVDGLQRLDGDLARPRLPDDGELGVLGPQRGDQEQPDEAEQDGPGDREEEESLGPGLRGRGRAGSGPRADRVRGARTRGMGRARAHPASTPGSNSHIQRAYNSSPQRATSSSS